MDKIVASMNKVVSVILILLMALMVLDVTWQVFTRFILQKPSSYTEELAGFLLIWIGLLGSSYALYTRAHLGIDVLTYKLQGLKRKIVEILVYLIVMVFAIFVLVIGGYNLVRMTLQLKQISPALGIKMGYVYTVIPITGVLFIIYSLNFIIEAIKKERLVTERKIVDSI